MTPPDRRSVGELLLDADYLARLTLLDADADTALVMLRTWPEVVQSAAELWSALPNQQDPDIMQRLEAITHSMHRDQTRRGWPGDGPTDERLLQIGESFTRAANLVSNRWRVPRRSRSRPSAAEAADVAAARTRIVHTLWVGGHSVSVATAEHAHDLRILKQSRVTPRVTRGIERGRDAQDRLGAFEGLAASWLKDRWPGALSGEHREPPDATRLGRALCQWDVQVHRTLAAAPTTTANLWLATATQATIVATAASLLHAGAQQGAVDVQIASRITPALQSNQQQWSHACGMWQQLHSPASSRFDNALAHAAGEVRAAAKQITHDPPGPAAPALITERIGRDRIGPLLGQALASSVELAHVIHATTASEEPILAPNNNLARITSARLRRSGHEMESVGVFPVALTSARANRLSPITRPIRNELVAAATALINSSHTAMAAGADLDRHRHATQRQSATAMSCSEVASRLRAEELTPASSDPHLSTRPSR